MPTIIKNVLVFNGTALVGPQTITINGTLIAPSSEGATIDGITIDGTGCTLLPGLIDAHVHIDQPSHLADCARLGVTTVCDMACQPLSTFKTMKAAQSPVKWLSAGQPAFSANSVHGKMFRLAGNNGKPVHTTDDAVEFVKDRIVDGVDYIKVIADAPGIEQETLNKIQEEAAKAEKMTIAHTAQYASFQRGLDAGFDILTHTPLDRKLSEEMAKRMAGRVTAVPTLTMMESFANSWLFWLLRGKQNFHNALDSVTAMRAAGVKILVGTDTNNLPVFGVMRGESMHHEMELLERAGLTPIEILQGATSLAAEQFGLVDRGRIEEGMRADLVLVRGNPTETITDSRRIERVWVGGEEVELAQEAASSCIVM